MDPIAHTLVGATLAETGLKRWSRYATATLLIGANLPDIDGIASFFGSDAALYYRRGWTHGVLALILLPLLLTAGLWLWDRWRGRRVSEGADFRMGRILGLSFLAVWSHPLLDWLNTYGVRLLMPFDGRWFYGDTLFIIDPWVWLLAGAGVVLARSATPPAMAGWALLGAAATVLVLGTDMAALAVKLVWLAGVAALILLRWRLPGFSKAVARTGFATLVVYICAAYGVARHAEGVLAQRFPQAVTAQANPLPGEPFGHRMVLVFEDAYRVVGADGEVEEVPRQRPDAVVRAALEAESVRGFVNWMRHPYWEVEEAEDQWIVTFRDLRYQVPGGPTHGIGVARVAVPKETAAR